MSVLPTAARGWWRPVANVAITWSALGRFCSTSPLASADAPHAWQIPKTLIFGDTSLAQSPKSSRLALADREVSVEDSLRALGEVTTPPVHLYNTNAHRTLTRFLFDHMVTLNRGTFPVNGTHARTIVGPKGIGKSTLLRQLVTTAEVVFPNVISMSYELPRPEELMVTLGLHLVDRDIINGAATIDDAIRKDELEEVVLESLMSKGKRLLLVVDEMDQLYRIDHTMSPDAGRAALRTLGSLALLGSVGGPVSAVLLCGSSAALPLLISCSATRDDALLRKEFPAVVCGGFLVHP
jgi:hypothetical protein